MFWQHKHVFKKTLPHINHQGRIYIILASCDFATYYLMKALDVSSVHLTSLPTKWEVQGGLPAYGGSPLVLFPPTKLGGSSALTKKIRKTKGCMILVMQDSPYTCWDMISQIWLK